MMHCEGLDDLAISLTGVVSDPEKVAALYTAIGDFCHHVCNELNTLKLALFLGERSSSAAARSNWSELSQRYQELERLIQDIQLVCTPMVLTPIRFSLGAFLRERWELWSRVMDERGKSLELIEPTHQTVGWFDPTRLAQALDGLVAWRSQVSGNGTTARLGWRAEDGHFELSWEEPGWKNAPAERNRVRPVSLALPILAKVVTAHGGEVAMAGTGGWHLAMRWPCDTASART